MTIGDYLFYSLVGVCVVFCALLLLMLVIKILMYQPKPKETTAPAATPSSGPQDTAPTAPVVPLAPGSAGTLKLYDTDPRDAALIMAIVADELKKPLNELRFISIREVRK